MLAELRAYKRIATADESARSWLMEVHGVVQDMTRILFVMVRHISPSDRDVSHCVGPITS